MEFEPLKREDLIRVIEGKGTASRIPLLYHFWINPGAFPDHNRQMVTDLLNSTPMDAQVIGIRMPDVYNAPADDPSFRWSYYDAERKSNALDSAGVISDWDEELDKFLDDFPDAEYPGMIPECPPDDGRYRLGTWWYFYFERLWSIRSMEDALTDFYLYPEAIHAFFRKLTDFYKRVITRAHDALHLDGIFTSDDLGTQKSTFFSNQIFEEFFAPYYKEVVDHVHSLGMHFWLHTCGNVEAFIPRYVDMGIDVLHPIQKYTMDEQKIARKFGDHLTFWAGFDVQQTIPYGTPEDVRREIRFMIDTYYREDGRFMLTLGNGATPDTPAESLKVLFEESLHYHKA